MIISYLGVESFKIQFGNTLLALNPVSKDSKFKGTRFGTDITLVSINHPDCNGAENTAHGEKEPFVISGPGEYEVKEVFIKGFISESNYGGKERINTIYSILLEGMTLCFLGAMSQKEISGEITEALDDIDILFVPIGGDGVLSATEGYKLAVKLEPKIIIPMHYGEVGEKNALKTFLNEGGEEKHDPQDKLTVKKKDLEGKKGEIVVLKS